MFGYSPSETEFVQYRPRPRRSNQESVGRQLVTELVNLRYELHAFSTSTEETVKRLTDMVDRLEGVFGTGAAPPMPSPAMPARPQPPALPPARPQPALPPALPAAPMPPIPPPPPPAPARPASPTTPPKHREDFLEELKRTVSWRADADENSEIMRV